MSRWCRCNHTTIIFYTPCIHCHKLLLMYSQTWNLSIVKTKSSCANIFRFVLLNCVNCVCLLDLLWNLNIWKNLKEKKQKNIVIMWEMLMPDDDILRKVSKATQLLRLIIMRVPQIKANHYRFLHGQAQKNWLPGLLKQFNRSLWVHSESWVSKSGYWGHLRKLRFCVFLAIFTKPHQFCLRSRVFSPFWHSAIVVNIIGDEYGQILIKKVV